MGNLTKFLSNVDIDFEGVDMQRARIRSAESLGKKTIAMAIREVLQGAPRTEELSEVTAASKKWLEAQLDGRSMTSAVFNAAYSSTVSALRRGGGVSRPTFVASKGNMKDQWAAAESARKARNDNITKAAAARSTAKAPAPAKAPAKAAPAKTAAPTSKRAPAKKRNSR